MRKLQKSNEFQETSIGMEVWRQIEGVLAIFTKEIDVKILLLNIDTRGSGIV